MKITANDIEICILTYNRAPLLKQALDSLISQTAKGFSISVYDNHSSDNTPEVVESFRKKVKDNFKYVRHDENIGPDANFHSALQGGSKKYIMLFHDDDVLHPKYVDYAICAINKFGDVALLCSNYFYKSVDSSAPIEWPHALKKAYFFCGQKDFAAYIFSGGRASFSSSIYRREDLLKYNRPNVYGKIGDTPVMIDTSAGGGTAVLSDKNIFIYRIHQGQDSKNSSNGPTREEIVNRNLLFKDILMNESFFYKFVYLSSYADWLATHIKFAGKDESGKRKFLRSLKRSETSGVLVKLYSIPAVGEILRGTVRILRTSYKLFWRPVDI